MTPKLLKATDVCALAQLQPYILRSWEKEFPGIGLQRSPDAPRLYRQSDVDQVLRIKQLVFAEGLTLAGARRRLDESAPVKARPVDDDVADVLNALASDARTRIAYVRDGLRSILRQLDRAPGTLVVIDDFRLEPPAGAPPVRARAERSSPRMASNVVRPSGTPPARGVAGKPVPRGKTVPAGGGGRGAQKRRAHA
jgi:DNA-binding transcriptional MerR regulator